MAADGSGLRAQSAAGRARGGRRRGFTLMELVVALVILATVLTIGYQILANILDTEREVSRLSTPEKIGQGILSLLRRDLTGVVYRNLGERCFQVYDNGEEPNARDEVQFFTTRDPVLPETLGGQFLGGGSDAAGYESFQGILAVSYFLRDTPGARAARVHTLFRRESAGLQGADPFAAGGGANYEIYDKVRSLSIECFDGIEWFTVWDSQSRLAQEAADAQALLEAASGIQRVSAPAGAPTGASSAAPAAGAGMAPLDETQPQVLPPAAVPVAVRISLVILAGDEKGAYTEGTGRGEFQEFKFTTVVPILTSQRIPLPTGEDEFGGMGISGADTEGTGPGGATFGSNVDPSSGRSGGKKASGGGRRATGAGARGAPGAGGPRGGAPGGGRGGGPGGFGGGPRSSGGSRSGFQPPPAPR